MRNRLTVELTRSRIAHGARTVGVRASQRSVVARSRFRLAGLAVRHGACRISHDAASVFHLLAVELTIGRSADRAFTKLISPTQNAVVTNARLRLARVAECDR